MTDTTRRPFPLFVAGALLYAVMVAICRPLATDMLDVLELLVPLFGLPYLLFGGRAGWASALYFLVLVPGFHYLAVVAAIDSADWHGSGFVPGMIGGLTGALLSFAALMALRLARPGAAAAMALGVAILIALGGLGVWQMGVFDGTPLEPYALLLVLYLPWQIAFGFFLARVLRVPADIGLVAEPAPA